MKVDVQLDTGPGAGVASLRERAGELAACGIDGLFTFEGPHDVFLPLATVAGTVDVDLATNVAIAPPRSPLHLAQAANDLQLMSGGRFRLGLGSQVRAHIENRYGSTWFPPAARMAEIVLAIRAIQHSWQHGTRLDFRGRWTRHTLMPPTLSPGPNPFGPPPILLGALGPVMTRTAAEVADGVLVMPFNSTRHLAERVAPAIAEGLARAERDPVGFAAVPQVIMAIGESAEQIESATAGVRALLAFYASTPAYRPVLEVEGRAELQPQLYQLARTGGPAAAAAMADLIDDPLLDALAVRGTPQECAAAALRRVASLEPQRICVYFPGSRPTASALSALVRALRADSVDFAEVAGAAQVHSPVPSSHPEVR